jgi:hypothetical protein
MMSRTVRLHSPRWLAVLLFSLIWATMGRATASAERGYFGHSGVVAKTTPALPAPRVRGNPNTAPTYEKIVVDSKGNAIPLKPGEYVTGSPDGRFIQVRDASGNPTGLRIDGPHKPASHPDPRAQVPHAHVPESKKADSIKLTSRFPRHRWPMSNPSSWEAIIWGCGLFGQRFPSCAW